MEETKKEYIIRMLESALYNLDVFTSQSIIAAEEEIEKAIEILKSTHLK